MFTDDDIYKYLKIKKDLEYKLIEEQYHFDSIPFRRKLSGFRLVSTIIFAIICSVFTFFCIRELYGTFEDNSLDLIESYTFIGLAMGSVFGLFISSAFWILTIKPAGELFGSLEKSSNYGAGNYAKERIVSMQKIRDYLDELDKVVTNNQSSLELIDGIPSDVADRDLGVLTVLLYALDQFLAPFLRKLGEHEPEAASVVGGVDAQIRCQDGLVDVPDG